jgi:DNA-binding SARP family transcriptional activator
MAHLRLSLLGPFQAELDGKPIAGFESDKVRALLAYLAAESAQPHSRAKLAGLLWPERPDSDARNNLRFALSNLRRAIGDREAAPPFLNVCRRTIQFNPESDSSVDVAQLAALIEQPSPGVPELEKAVELYRGDFLEGFFVADSVAFEEWMLLRREQLRRGLLAALHLLAAAYEARGEYNRALPYAYRQVELEPWQEKGHRQIMRLLALDGQRGAALAQYEACRRALAEGLGADPGRETIALYKQIRDEQVPPTPMRADDSAPPVGLASRVGTLRGTILLLVVAGAVALGLIGMGKGLFGGVSPDIVPTLELHTPSQGRILHLCEGSRPPQICIHDVPTGHVSQLTDDLEFHTIGRVAWSPDGAQIVIDAAVGHPDSADGYHRLYIIAADGPSISQLTAQDASDAEPAWSPDGESIAFNREGELWVIRPDGSGARRLLGGATDPIVGDLAWSPDGRRIAFVGLATTVAHDPEAVWVVECDGTAPEAVYPLPPGLKSAEVMWSHDGSAILCQHGRDGEERRLVLVDAGGDGEIGVLDTLPYWWHPSFWPQWDAEA